MNSAIDLLFLGLPETGKTTYFIALDEVLHWSQEEHGLVSDGFAADRTYIEDAKKDWRAGRAVQRTNRMTLDEPVELLVRNPMSGARARLIAPDVNGEFFDAQWSDRRWPVAYRNRLASVAGVFVFINAKHNAINPEMVQAWVNTPSDAPAEKPKAWEPRGAAKQTKLVDILQFIAACGNARRPLPLAVMISAWDEVEKRDSPTRLPEKFLSEEWSLLHQYIQSNPALFQKHVYGVSARGGGDADRARLVGQAPHDRVWLKDGTEVTSDITRPLRWLLDWK